MQQIQLQKLLDWGKIERTGSREIVPVDEKKFQQLQFSTYKDRATGITYGDPVGTNPDGTFKFKKFTITGRTYYNLENDEDARAWAIVKNHPRVLGSKLQKDRPLLKIHDRVEEARLNVQRYAESQDALKIALNLQDEELFDFARVIGVTVANTEPIVVKQLVSEKAQKNPTSFMASYNDQNRGVFQVFKRAMDANLITHRIDAGYLFKDTIPLGDSEVAVIAYLLKERKHLTNIDIESRKILSERGSIYKIEEASLVNLKKEEAYTPTSFSAGATAEEVIAKLKEEGYELVKTNVAVENKTKAKSKSVPIVSSMEPTE